MDETSRGSVIPIDRRVNHGLRRLIDEMLGRVRRMHNTAPLWTPEERAQAEAELELIMARVVSEASRQRQSGAADTPATGMGQ